MKAVSGLRSRALHLSISDLSAMAMPSPSYYRVAPLAAAGLLCPTSHGGQGYQPALSLPLTTSPAPSTAELRPAPGDASLEGSAGVLFRCTPRSGAPPDARGLNRATSDATWGIGGGRYSHLGSSVLLGSFSTGAMPAVEIEDSGLALCSQRSLLPPSAAPLCQPCPSSSLVPRWNTGQRCAVFEVPDELPGGRHEAQRGTSTGVAASPSEQLESHANKGTQMPRASQEAWLPTRQCFPGTCHQDGCTSLHQRRATSIGTPSKPGLGLELPALKTSSGEWYSPRPGVEADSAVEGAGRTGGSRGSLRQRHLLRTMSISPRDLHESKLKEEKFSRHMRTFSGPATYEFLSRKLGQELLTEDNGCYALVSRSTVTGVSPLKSILKKSRSSSLDMTPRKSVTFHHEVLIARLESPST